MRMNCEYTLLVPKENVNHFLNALKEHLEKTEEREYCFVLYLKNISDYNPNHPSVKVNALPVEIQNYEAIGLHNGSIDYLSFSRVENGETTVYIESEIDFCVCKEKGIITGVDKHWNDYPMFLHSKEWNEKNNPTFSKIEEIKND